MKEHRLEQLHHLQVKHSVNKQIHLQKSKGIQVDMCESMSTVQLGYGEWGEIELCFLICILYVNFPVPRRMQWVKSSCTCSLKAIRAERVEDSPLEHISLSFPALALYKETVPAQQLHSLSCLGRTRHAAATVLLSRGLSPWLEDVSPWPCPRGHSWGTCALSSGVISLCLMFVMNYFTNSDCYWCCLHALPSEAQFRSSSANGFLFSVCINTCFPPCP